MPSKLAGWLFLFLMNVKSILFPISVFICSLMLGCQAKVKDEDTSSQVPVVVVTTTMIGDMVQFIAGEHAQVLILMGPEVDPHLYKASASDLEKLRKADLIFYNGLHLEGKMDELFSKMQQKGTCIHAITAHIPSDQLFYPSDFEGHPDPHVWFDPTLWAIGTEIVANALATRDPAHADFYHTHAKTLTQKYLDLHAWTKETLSVLPKDKRILITSHDAFNYFGKAYDFDVIGVQGISTASEAGLADIAQTIDFIRRHSVKAIFVESSVPHATIERISKDAGINIGGELFSDALGTPGEIEISKSKEQYDLGSYEGMIKHNTNSILHALQ